MLVKMLVLFGMADTLKTLGGVAHEQAGIHRVEPDGIVYRYSFGIFSKCTIG